MTAVRQSQHWLFGQLRHALDAGDPSDCCGAVTIQRCFLPSKRRCNRVRITHGFTVISRTFHNQPLQAESNIKIQKMRSAVAQPYFTHQ